jgi:hypothetical protein
MIGGDYGNGSVEKATACSIDDATRPSISPR